MEQTKIPDCYCLDANSKHIVEKLALSNNVTNDLALRYIIGDWEAQKYVKTKSSTPEVFILDDLYGKIDEIDKELDEVLLKLKRASL